MTPAEIASRVSVASDLLKLLDSLTAMWESSLPELTDPAEVEEAEACIVQNGVCSRAIRGLLEVVQAQAVTR
jgi:hypothetical protein